MLFLKQQIRYRNKIKIFRYDYWNIGYLKVESSRYDLLNNAFKYEDAAVLGLGLGLLITKQIVEAYGGGIFVESTIGNGAIFTAKFLI